MNESRKVNDKILAKIIKDIKFIFEGISARDEKIIKENFIIKQQSWDDLGEGMKNVINMITPITYSIYKEELVKALQNDMKTIKEVNMPDIHDMELDARPTDQELYGECKHEQREYQPLERDTNVQESYHCVDCGEELVIPEPDEDTMRGEDR